MTTQTRRARVTAYVTLMVVLLMGIGLAVFVGPAVYSTRNNTDQVRRGNEMAACRSLLAYEVNTAKAELDILFAEGLQAVVAEDDAATAELAEQIPGRAKAVRLALESQRVGNELSRDEPEAFLAQCEGR